MKTRKTKHTASCGTLCHIVSHRVTFYTCVSKPRRVLFSPPFWPGHAFEPPLVTFGCFAPWRHVFPRLVRLLQSIIHTVFLQPCKQWKPFQFSSISKMAKTFPFYCEFSMFSILKFREKTGSFRNSFGKFFGKEIWEDLAEIFLGNCKKTFFWILRRSP